MSQVKIAPQPSIIADQYITLKQPPDPQGWEGDLSRNVTDDIRNKSPGKIGRARTMLRYKSYLLNSTRLPSGRRSTLPSFPKRQAFLRPRSTSGTGINGKNSRKIPHSTLAKALPLRQGTLTKPIYITIQRLARSHLMWGKFLNLTASSKGAS
jgi:hypothetical protein